MYNMPSYMPKVSDSLETKDCSISYQIWQMWCQCWPQLNSISTPTFPEFLHNPYWFAGVPSFPGKTQL